MSAARTVRSCLGPRTQAELAEPNLHRRASASASAAAPPVGIVVVNVDDPHNQPLVERFKVFSFPVGKVFHHGRFALDYGGGSQDFEIVEWMLAMRDEHQRGAAETRRAGKEELYSQSHSETRFSFGAPR